MKAARNNEPWRTVDTSGSHCAAQTILFFELFHSTNDKPPEVMLNGGSLLLIRSPHNSLSFVVPVRIAACCLFFEIVAP